MKSILLIVLILAISIQISSQLSKSRNDEWGKFVQRYNKVYENAREHDLRKNIWNRNLKYIEKHNRQADKGRHTFRLGMNEFGDLTRKEFKSMLTKMNDVATSIKSNKPVNFNVQIPDSVDWRDNGCVGPVREESSTCNALYAFGAAETLSGFLCAKDGKLTKLSPQQLIDCSRNFGNSGCEGGDIGQAYLYISKAGGIESEASYPFVGHDQQCSFNPKDVVVTDNGYIDLPVGNETLLTQAIANLGPISVGIDAGLASFQFYRSGIYYDPACTPQVDHMVLLAGYGSAGSDQDFYIAQNSWGTSWGMQGYIELSRNKQNNCGVASYVKIPEIKITN